MAGGVNYTKMGQEMLSEEEKRKQQQQQQRPMAPAMPMQAGGGSFSQFSPYGRGLL
jgi:small neutral amino acid transporter SnatA (MarC family)